MTLSRVGIDIDSTTRWEEMASRYAHDLSGSYHAHRLAAIKRLLPDLRGKRVLDFGCGDGVLAEIAVNCGATVSGLDVSETMIELARKRVPSGTFLMGGAGDIAGNFDVLIAANVLAYLSPDEEQTFYKAAQSASTLIVTHSNVLFDLFTFNAYTVDFYRREFGCDVAGLVTNPDKPNRATFSVRENPLAYTDKLRRYGFRQTHIEFMNYHPKPPLLLSEDPDDMQRERPGMKDVEPWKLLLQCSMFGVRAERV